MKTKRTLKSIIAFALALILSLGAVSTAFAVDVGETIEWEYEDDYDEYTGFDYYVYKGELALGENAIVAGSPADSCYTFNAEKAGYYLFSSSDNTNVNVSEEIKNDLPCDYARYVYGYNLVDEETDEYECYKLICIPAGTVYVAVYTYAEYLSQDTLEIEYLGAELTDVNIDENDLKDLIKDYDFGYGSGKGFEFRADATFTFDGENEKVLDGALLRLDTLDGSEVVEGENVVKTINTFGIEKEYTLTCYSINHYISKVEISNLDKYLTYKQYYRDDIYDSFGFYTENDGKGISGETLTVTLSDGSTQSFVLDWGEEIKVKLPNGREFNVYMGENYHPYNDTVCFEAMICGVTVLEKECRAIEATAKENLDMLKRHIEGNISSFKYWMELYINRLSECESVGEAVKYIRPMINLISDRAREIFSEIGDYCGYLILG